MLETLSPHEIPAELWKYAINKTSKSKNPMQFIESRKEQGKNGGEILWECPSCGYWNQDQVSTEWREVKNKEGIYENKLCKVRKYDCQNVDCQDHTRVRILER